MTFVRTASLACLLLVLLASAPRAQDRTGPRELPRPDLAPAARAGADPVAPDRAVGATPEGASATPEAASAPAGAAAAPPPDPFATSRPMLEAARRASTGRGEPASADTSHELPATAMPKLRLRGTLRVRGRAPAALIEVDGALYLVRSGDRLDVTAPSAAGARAPGPLTLEVVGVADGTVTLRAGPDTRPIVVR